jgi:hypothetical protein
MVSSLIAAILSGSNWLGTISLINAFALDGGSGFAQCDRALLTAHFNDYGAYDDGPPRLI